MLTGIFKHMKYLSALDLKIIFFLIITFNTSDLTFASKSHSNQDQLNMYHLPDLTVYSLEELNYETCKINDHRRANQEGGNVKNLDLTPENMRPMLLNYMCDFTLGSGISGSPRQLSNRDHNDYRVIDGQHKSIFLLVWWCGG